MPWYVWTSVASIASILIGGYWDISWHMTVGRDTFWTPAHLVIQFGGVLAGSAGAYQIIAATLRRDHTDGVRVWGFRGPLGAYVAVWGAVTMAISAPFDNWWHDAYGLDVKILSPPHVVLTLGVLAVSVGGVLQLVRALNRSEVPIHVDRVLLLVAGMQITLGMMAILEYTFRSNMHRAECYRAIATNIPVMMLAFASVSRHRWACTIMAGTYTAFMAAMVWIFPLFAAEAKLGPVYQPITHMIPLQFPLLIIVPAFAIDVVRWRFATWPRWRLALVLGPVFVATLVAVQWPFASFLMSEHARNGFFGTEYFPYFAHPDWREVRYLFFEEPDFLAGVGRAALFATAGAYLGLLVGGAMKKVRR